MPKATPPKASASPPPVETLWQIGKPKGGKQEFLPNGGWSQEFNYDVEADSDPINRPQVPGIISLIRSTNTAKEAATAKLNIHFNLKRNYEQGQLILFYARFGSPDDSLFLDGELIQTIPGQKDGKFQQNEIPLKALSTGKHTLSITTAGKSGKHAIDYLKLQASTAKTQPIPSPAQPQESPPTSDDKPAPEAQPTAEVQPESKEKQAPPPAPKTEIKPETEAQRRLLATGLEDYGFWWQQMAKENASPKEKKPFRRGRIWS
jgi:cyanobactin cluster PatC/TenC/TruC protein